MEEVAMVDTAKLKVTPEALAAMSDEDIRLLFREEPSEAQWRKIKRTRARLRLERLVERASNGASSPTNADMVAKHVAMRSILPQIPETDEQSTIARIVADPVWACWHYFPDWFTRPPCDLTTQVINRVWHVCLHGGSQSIGVIRGGGKSTITKALMTLAGLCGLVRYCVVFGANAKAARSILHDIIMQLETNEMLMEDFPAACIPIRALRGRAQRCASQSYMGERTYIEYTTEGVKLAQIPGRTCSGWKVICKGIDSGFLGLVDNGVRPDFVLCDDIQSLEAAKSDAGVASLESTIRQGLLGLGGKGNPLRIVQLCTCTRENDFSDRILDPELYPEYSGLRIGLVLNWGNNEWLWENYCELWRQDNRDGDKLAKTANEFYANHRERMDEGVVVTDPAFYVAGVEQSTIQGAWNARIQMGEEAYFAQMENRPLSPSTTIYEINPKIVASRLNGNRRRAVPDWATHVFAYSDIGADSFRWSIIACGAKMRTAVIDYGTFPEAGRVVQKNASKTEETEAIWRAMGALCDYWSKTLISRQGDEMREVRISAAGFDRGYNAEAVQQFANRRSKDYAFPIVPLRGQGWSQWSDKPRSLLRQGWNCQLVRTIEGAAPGDYLNVRTDFYKELVQRSFLVENPDGAGACSLWGRDNRAHADYADSICSEVLNDKGRGVRGIEFWRWILRPGRSNHYFDSLVGCYALAGYWGAIRPEDGFEGAAPSPTAIPQAVDAARKLNTRRANNAGRLPRRRATVEMEG